jgi:hypothetical protein
MATVVEYPFSSLELNSSYLNLFGLTYCHQFSYYMFFFFFLSNRDLVIIIIIII